MSKPHKANPARKPATGSTVRWGYALVVVALLFLTHDLLAQQAQRRIFVVDSYHPAYLWSQSTQRGLIAALRKYGYLENDQQAEALAWNGEIETPRVAIQKAWMDSKRNDSRAEIANATVRIMREIADFRPDLVMLGDDNAANYIGNQLLDSETPVVFWGINGLPLKYGLVESMDRPGHNVTGIWQAGYHRESLELLKRLVPEAQTFAILACDSVTSRPNIKQIEALAARGELPLELIEVVRTNSFEEFKARALHLSRQVDAFFVLNHDTLRDTRGQHVPILKVGRWYLENIRKPEVSHEDQFVREGMLATANDSGFNQAYHAFEMAYDILEQGFNPAHVRTRTPPHGPFLVNQERANMLGIDITPHLSHIDDVVESALALHSNGQPDVPKAVP